mmetsp:Transcript_130574/g.279176  ORF Transcript_130574/g.279176 Transcript_130574/m.279176 type:complete len:474 (-) Transcript_130574:159-1580(-)
MAGFSAPSETPAAASAAALSRRDSYRPLGPELVLQPLRARAGGPLAAWLLAAGLLAASAATMAGLVGALWPHLLRNSGGHHPDRSVSAADHLLGRSSAVTDPPWDGELEEAQEQQVVCTWLAPGVARCGDRDLVTPEALCGAEAGVDCSAAQEARFRIELLQENLFRHREDQEDAGDEEGLTTRRPTTTQPPEGHQTVDHDAASKQRSATTQPPEGQRSTTTQHPEVTTTTPALVVARRPPSLFCISVMQSTGANHELSLLRSQLREGVGVFGCDDWLVLSDIRTWLTPGPPVRMDTVPLQPVPGGSVAGEFLEVWDGVRRDGRFDLHDWVAKVHVDAVFFPNRLRQHLPAPDPKGLYLLNCNLRGDLRMLGALEVISTRALEAYFQGTARCRKELELGAMGEGEAMRRCLDLLGVASQLDLGLLGDGRCGGDSSPSCTTGRVAFHPFKEPTDYFFCLKKAEEAATAQRRLRG